ncbi:MAG: DUF4249 family protein [Paludibacteraceae bacterium]|nr:DUF4249 family protein [Paludibacteraceae bacterium]
MCRKIYIFLFALCLIACEREIPYNGEYQNAKMVIHAVVNSGEDSLTCYIGRSYFFLDTKPRTPEVLDSLAITLNGTSGNYAIIRDSVAGIEHHLRLARPIEAGDTLRLQVTHPTFGTATAQEALPPDFIPQVVETVWEKGPIPPDNNYRIRLRLPDYPVADKEVQMTCITYTTHIIIGPRLDSAHNIEKWDTIVNPYEYYGMLSKDELLAGYNQYIYAFEAYSGRSFIFYTGYPSGKEFEVSINTRYPYDSWQGTEPYQYYATYTLDSCVMTFELKSNVYDLYYNSMVAYMGLNESTQREFDLGQIFTEMLGQEEPMPVYCNIENGFGILASKTRTKIKIK